MAVLLKVSRSSVITAYELLEERIYFTVGGKGTFVQYRELSKRDNVYIDWSKNTNNLAKAAEKLDIMKQEQIYKRNDFL